MRRVLLTAAISSFLLAGCNSEADYVWQIDITDKHGNTESYIAEDYYTGTVDLNDSEYVVILDKDRHKMAEIQGVDLTVKATKVRRTNGRINE